MTITIRTWLTIILLNLLASCISKDTKVTAQNARTLKESLADSINRFYFMDDYTKRDDSSTFVLHGTTINNKKIGLIALTDSCLLLFQTINNTLKQTDSIKFDSYAFSFEITDLNGDNKEDFIINSVPDIHGQTTPFVFLFKEDNLLHYRPDLQLSNIRYNSVNRSVESYYESCAYCVHSKAVYTWEADTLKLIKSAELDLTASKDKDITTRVYQLVDGQEKQILNIKGVNSVYDTVLFKIHDCD